MQAIEHVIHLSPENRSFHYVLGFLENHINHYNYDLDGNRIYCSPIDAPTTGGDAIVHDIAATTASIQGVNNEPMTGFVQANQRSIYNLDADEPQVYQADPTQLMGYVKEGGFPILHTLAKNFCVCNRWFSSAPTETFPNRNYMIAATSAGHDNNLPKETWELIYSTTTIFDRLDQKNISWKIYYPNYLDLIVNLDVDAFPKLSHLTELNTLITDLTNGTLPVYSYVELDTNDDSIEGLVPYRDTVENYIGKVYNTLRSSSYWNKTLLIIAFDEHGGFYDPILPPLAPSPDNKAVVYHSSANPSEAVTFNFNQYGIRVPAILISPWVENGVDSTTYDHTSILAFLENRFNLDPLTNRDAVANWNFKFRSTPRNENEMPLQIAIPPGPTTVTPPPTLANKILIAVTGFLAFIGRLCSKF
jgi:phospholipase C